MSRSFRVWDNQAKSYDWDREFVLSSDGNLMELRSNHNGTWDYHFADEDRFIVEQYTGLKDENGKEIYEGDIVKCGDWLMRVVWEKDFASFEVVYPDNNIEYGVFTRASLEWVVIGNIHENPELLEN